MYWRRTRFWPLVVAGAVLRLAVGAGAGIVITSFIHIISEAGFGWMVDHWFVSVPGAVLAIAGLVGIGLEVRYLAAVVRCQRRLQAAVLPPAARLKGAAEGVGLAAEVHGIMDSRVFALTYGLWRPRVVVSEGMLDQLDDDELAAVLEHEAEHVRARDPLRILMCHLASVRLPMLPVLQFLEQRASRDAELAADDRAEHRVGAVPLAKALLSIIESVPGRSYAVVGATAAFGDRELLAERIGRLEGLAPAKARPRPRQVVGTVIGVTLLTLGFGAVAGIVLDIWFTHA